MFSKIVSIFTFLCFGFGFSGCGLKTGEPVVNNEVAKIQSTACLSGSIDELALFFKGEAADQQIDSALTCISNVLISFKNNVRGKQSNNSYTPDEVGYFISENFLSDNKKLSSRLMVEIAKIKTSLVGGSKNEFTKDEIEKLSELINHLRPELVRLNPYLKKLFKNINFTSDDFFSFENELQSSVSRFSVNLKYQINLEDIYNFILVLEQDQLIEGFKIPEKFDGFYQAALDFKFILTVQKDNIVKYEQLSSVLQSLTLSYLHYTEYVQFLKKDDLNAYDKHLRYFKMVPKVHQTLKNILLSKQSREISNEEFISLYTTLNKYKFINIKITNTSFNTALSVLWSHVLNPVQARIRGEKQPAFNLTVLDEFQKEAFKFTGAQLVLSEVFVDTEVQNKESIVNYIQKRLQTETDNSRIEVLAKLRTIFSGTVSHTFDDLGFLRFFTADMNNFKLHDVMHSNLAQFLSALAIKSFANDLDRAQQGFGITLEETQIAFDLLKSIVYDLELVSPQNTTFISSRFREANLFVSRANGDQFAGYEELHDLILHIFSGLKRADRIQIQAVKKCRPDLKAPVSGSVRINQDCLLDAYFIFGEGFESMPRFIDMKSQPLMDEAVNKGYYLSLLKAAGHKPNADNEVVFDDANLFPHVVQYIEVIFYKYDLNQDNVLSKDEALIAFPVFKNTIKDVIKKIPGGGLIGASKHKGVFMYLLKYGKAPSGSEEFGQFMKFISSEKEWDFETSRLNLGAIFNYIADNL